MQRYLKSTILEDSKKKIVLISGPRQCGKTTLVKNLFKSINYFNYDLEEDRKMLRKKHWQRDKECTIFDELHKMKYSKYCRLL